VRVVDHDVRFGVTTDEGDGDEWPRSGGGCWTRTSSCSRPRSGWDSRPRSARWSSSGWTPSSARPTTTGTTRPTARSPAVAVVGNEDGAHHVVAECLQALNDTGFSIPANACTYWVGEAMQGTDYNDLDETPDATESTTRTMAAYAVHLARLLQSVAVPARRLTATGRRPTQVTDARTAGLR
jgi:hypothetical protein